MRQIIILEQNMVNMIAAGEVIERPASVVKELVENSIDAGATQIIVSVEDGGRKLITVTDNGYGMDCDDLANAFEPHATSKIKTTKDLHCISTLGFRGEALASIASIAQVKAVSKTKDSLNGNCIDIDCGQKSNIRPCSADLGTRIEVRDIFYKLPARRKFLKTANTEMAHITEQCIRTALANINIDFTLISNARLLYNLKAGQTLPQRISSLFSSEIAENLIETESDEKKTGLHIYALLGKPEISRTNNKLQYIFLNGRFIRDKFISHAVKEAYRGCIEQGRFPVIFLLIKMPCDKYDVNVHPTKIEVRFYNANLVHSQVLAVLREKLLATDIGVEAKLPTPQQRNRQIEDAMSEFFKKHRSVQTQQQIGFRPPPPITKYQTQYAKQGVEYESYLPGKRNFLQIHDSFIIAETDDGFCIIDQHALHERIMYENLRSRIKKDKLESQKLLIPESFEVTAAEADAIQHNIGLIEQFGIELVPFGPKTMAIQAFAVMLAKVSPLDFIKDLLDLLGDKSKNENSRKLLDEILNMAACKAAVKAGQKLNDKEIEQLLADKENLERAGRCPHGRPTMIKFSRAELEKQFKRT